MAIEKLPQDKLPIDAVKSCFECLKSLLFNGEDAANYAACAIGRLPQD